MTVARRPWSRHRDGHQHGHVDLRRPRLFLVAVLVALLGLLPATAAASPAAAPVTDAPTVTAAPAALRTVALSSLPREAAQTYRLIRAGGPFPHSQDGTTFRNREGILPARGAGYYREYTVETPGSDDRGARRLVTGSGGEVYYTGDHYASFVAVDVAR